MILITFDDYRPLVFEGLGTTVLITVLSLILGTLLGGVIYVMSMNRRRWMREFSKGYRYIVRGMPLMVLLLFFFFAVLAGNYGILAAVLAFSINFSNFAYAIIQSSFDAVGKEQMKAARALGFTHLQSLRYVIVPQAFRIATPSYKFQAVSMLKGTAVVGYVSILDITQVAQIIRAGTGELLLPLIDVTIIYFILAWLLCKLIDKIVHYAKRI